MKRKQLAAILFAMSFALITGCGNKAQDTGSLPEQTESQQPQEEQTVEEQTTDSDLEEGKQENEDTETGETKEQSQSAGYEQWDTYTWEEITISIPKEWEGKYQIEEADDGFSLIQTASYEKEEGMGFLCGIYREDGMVIDSDMAGATSLAYTSDETYYMVEPTDVPYYYEDEKIASEYREMYHFIHAIGASIKVDKEGVKYNPDEFILPLSGTVEIKEEYLLNLSSDDLRIARNEIYARHGRKFEDALLQNYFDSCSWYEGTVSSGEFDEAVLSQIEKDNLKVIQKAEEAYKKEHPYPKLYEVSKEVKEDLDGDGKTENVRYTVTEEDGNYEGKLTIAGKEFSLSKLDVYLTTPNEEQFAITDISPYFEGLEIAIMDYGPSEDLVTYFFSYAEEELNYLGCVGGFPFKELGGFNGFVYEGTVKGIGRADLINTCFAYKYWYYDYENKKLEESDTGYFPLVLQGSHELYEDLPVYLECDENSTQSTIPAQERVFFLATDGKEWILVRGKDGSKGYMHIVDGKVSGLSKEASEVFSDLFFAD